MKKNRAGNSQASQSELNFISNLGTGEYAAIHAPKLEPIEQLEQRIKMLRGYIYSVPRRKYWWIAATPSLYEREARKQLAVALRKKLISVD